MPGLSGIDLLRLVRQSNLDVPAIVLTGNPSLETAISAVQYGGFRYLQKPTEVLDLPKVVRDASAMHRLAMLKRRALELYETEGWLIGDQAGLESHFEKALDQLWIAFQPIVSWPERSVFGHEALVRSAEPTLNNPALLFEAAERLGRTQELGRKIRAAVTARMGAAPRNGSIFVNLHAADLADEELYSSRALLSGHAGRVVLEVTERSSLERIPDVRGKMARLRRLGFRIAVDDLGAGYAGLASFSQLEPDIAKLDMSLVRGIDSSATKASIVRSRAMPVWYVVMAIPSLGALAGRSLGPGASTSRSQCPQPPSSPEEPPVPLTRARLLVQVYRHSSAAWPAGHETGLYHNAPRRVVAAAA
jgi:EAL domain-containing protein (putative c-di-GMP-specific phosphodiesterase class I)